MANDTPVIPAAVAPPSGSVGVPSVAFPPWIDGRQLCAEVDPDLHHPDRDALDGYGNAAEQTYAAQAVCRLCPLQRPCLTWSLEKRERWGVWGGRSYKWRQETLRKTGGDPERLAAAVEAAIERDTLVPPRTRRVLEDDPDDGESAA